MAIKVALAAALLVALVAAATATTYTTTTITTTSYDEEGGRQQQQCRQQVQGRQFRACQSYLQQRSSPYNEVEGEANPQRESVEECCQQLRQMDRNQCGCEAIKHAVRQAQQGGSHRSYQTGSQSEQMFQKARQLPRMCGLREQQCRFNVVLV